METIISLPGLDCLLEVCRRLNLDVTTTPPCRVPPVAGTPVADTPLDPVLAAFYSRFGRAVFATQAAGMGLFRVEDDVNELEEENRKWKESWQERLPLQLFVFGGETGLAQYFATVPALADGKGRQPVVEINVYEEPYALPIASDVDRFFEAYARYLEELLAQPDYEEYGAAALSFPWRVPEILARDGRLVEMLRAGRFAALLGDDEVREWVRQVSNG